MTNPTRKSFHVVLLFFSYVGFYNSKKSRILKIWSYISYMFIILVTGAMSMNLYLEENVNNMRKNQTVLSVISGGFAIFKLLPFLVNGARVEKCIEYFNNPKFTPTHETEREIFETCVKVCSRNTKLYTSGLLFSIVLWCLLKFYVNEFPLDVWLPYDPNSEPVIFYITFFSLSLGTLYVLLIINGVEPLIGGLLYFATCQMRILKYNLQNLEVMEKHNQAYKNLRLCVLRHNDILNFIDEFKECFNLSMLSQIGGNTLSLCYCCIGLTLASPTSKEGISYLTISTLYCCQLLFYCFFGTLLFEENEELINAIYLGPWYKYDARIKKMLLFIMERSKKPLILTAGRVVDLTLQTFTSILKTSYSLVAVVNSYR